LSYLRERIDACGDAGIRLRDHRRQASRICDTNSSDKPS